MTSLSVSAVIGSQEPSERFVPEGGGFHGEDAALLASGYGLTLDPWQQDVLSVWMLESENGRWAASTCGLSVPRQNGKNGVIEVRQLYGMVEFGEKFLHTAHEVKTARKAFARLLEFFDNRDLPSLKEMVKEVRRTNGQEAIFLRNGGSVEFVARSKGSGRGYTVDTLVCDEAQHMTDEQLEALKSTISAAPSGRSQTIYTGTPPKPEDAAEVFPRVRKNALEDRAARLAWHEWACGQDVDLDDPEAWRAANPGLGIRLHPETIEDERVDLSDDGFLRERLGCWSTSSSLSVIDADVWFGLTDEKSKRDPNAPIAWAVDVTPDRSATSIGVASDRTDGLRHVEMIENHPGTSWAVPRLVELVGRWGGEVGLDPASQAGSLITELQEAGIEPHLLNTRDATQGCGLFVKMATEDKSLRHLGQPKLNAAVDAGRKRTVGTEGGWCWNRRDMSSDISPLVAVTNANFLLGKPSKRRQPTGEAQFF